MHLPSTNAKSFYEFLVAVSIIFFRISYSNTYLYTMFMIPITSSKQTAMAPYICRRQPEKVHDATSKQLVARPSQVVKLHADTCRHSSARLRPTSKLHADTCKHGSARPPLHMKLHADTCKHCSSLISAEGQAI